MQQPRHSPPVAACGTSGCSILTVVMVTGLPWSGEVVCVLQVAVKGASRKEWVEQAEVRAIVTVSQDPE